MTIRTSYNGKLYEEIHKNNSFVMGLSVSNSSAEFDTIDLDELQFNDSFIRIKRNLPNGSSVEFLICEVDKETADRYRGFESLRIAFDDIEIIGIV